MMRRGRTGSINLSKEKVQGQKLERDLATHAPRMATTFDAGDTKPAMPDWRAFHLNTSDQALLGGIGASPLYLVLRREGLILGQLALLSNRFASNNFFRVSKPRTLRENCSPFLHKKIRIASLDVIFNAWIRCHRNRRGTLARGSAFEKTSLITD